MNHNHITGLKAETVVYELLKRNLPDFDICWTRKEKRNNEPFDFEVYGKKNAVLLIEVKAFSEGRKWYWTQFKRPAIKRKKARMRQLGNPQAITIVVKFWGESAEIRWEEGFPSQPFTKFRSRIEWFLIWNVGDYANT